MTIPPQSLAAPIFQPESPARLAVRQAVEARRRWYDVTPLGMEEFELLEQQRRKIKTSANPHSGRFRKLE